MQNLNLGSLGRDRPSPWVRQLFRTGTIIRWVGLGVAGTIGALVPSRAPSLLVGLILAVGVYNAVSMWLANRLADANVLRVAQGVTILDEVACLVFLAIYPNLPGGTQIAFYVPMLVEAVAFGGVVGAGEAVAVFSVGIVGVEWARFQFFKEAFSWPAVLLWILVILVVSVSIAALDRTVQGIAIGQAPPEARGDAPRSAAAKLQLSRREQEVLQLIAAGQSDAMIATRLHLSETTVKTHVVTLRTRLGAKTRAEAVAIASRLNLLDHGNAGPQI
jgi:DNA-binding CsgD family transcriptional regulator